jgi:hypothetical protein
MSYRASILILLFLTIGTLSGLAITIEKTMGWNYCLTGSWIGSLGVIFLGWSWLSPRQIVAWKGSGIDSHPNTVDRVLIENEHKQFSIWQQPNRLKFTVAFITLAFGEFLQALGQTFDFYL